MRILTTAERQRIEAIEYLPYRWWEWAQAVGELKEGQRKLAKTLADCANAEGEVQMSMSQLAAASGLKRCNIPVLMRTLRCYWMIVYRPGTRNCAITLLDREHWKPLGARHSGDKQHRQCQETVMTSCGYDTSQEAETVMTSCEQTVMTYRKPSPARARDSLSRSNPGDCRPPGPPTSSYSRSLVTTADRSLALAERGARRSPAPLAGASLTLDSAERHMREDMQTRARSEEMWGDDTDLTALDRLMDWREIADEWEGRPSVVKENGTGETHEQTPRAREAADFPITYRERMDFLQAGWKDNEKVGMLKRWMEAERPGMFDGCKNPYADIRKFVKDAGGFVRALELLQEALPRQREGLLTFARYKLSEHRSGAKANREVPDRAPNFKDVLD